MRFVFFGVGLSVCLISGCGGFEQSLDRQIEDRLEAERASNAALVNKVDSGKPILITAAQRLREQSKDLGGGLLGGLTAGTMPRLQALEKPIQIQETVLNAGKNATGLKFTLTGTALSNRLVEPVQFLDVVTFFDGTTRREFDRARVALSGSSDGTLSGQANDLRYESLIELSATLKPLKNGEGTLLLDVQPIQSGGKSTAQFSRAFSIKPESEVRKFDW